MIDTNKSNPYSLISIFVFLAVFLGSGVYFAMQGVDYAFYQISASVAVLPAVAFGILSARGKLNESINTFIAGVSDSNIITMCIIYLLAGAYGSVAKSVGGVDAAVGFGLSIIPEQFILPGIFIMGAFISTAMGTSMGTIAAITPIAAGLAHSAGLSMPLTLGAVVGGAMFGDNLSMISDTTIATVQTQGCKMKDKFLVNLWIALPAMVLTIILLVYLGESGAVSNPPEYHLTQLLPYLFVLILALLGVNVFVVLAVGIIVAASVGFYALPDYTLLKLSKSIYSGYTEMQEILVLTLFIGGLSGIVKQQGGLNIVLKAIKKVTDKFTSSSTSVRAGELGIASIVSIADICTANNTVAIILTGDTAREIAQHHKVDPRRAASILDIFSCVFQGILPYSAQLLLAGSIALTSPFEIAGHVYYCIILGVMTILAILFKYPKLKERTK